DLKPQNVLLTDARSVASGLKLTDFGIAWTRGALRERGPTGTLTYMAPEQIEVEDHHYGPWTDLYGLGCLLWEIATGEPPFDDRPGRPLAMAHLLEEPPPLRARFPVPDALSAWMRRLLAKEPAERFQSAADALRALLGDDAIDDGAAVTVAAGSAQQDAGLRLFGLRDVPMVGRREEVATLESALEQAAEEPVLLAFEGPEGVGRSRLLRWLHEHVEERGEAFSVLIRGTSEGRELTRGLVDRLGGAGLEGEALRAQLAWRTGLHPVDPDVRRELVDVLAPPPGRSVDRADRNHVVARWLSEVAAERRVTFVVDDAHHAADSLDVARHLMRDHGRPPVLVVLAFADGELPDEHAALLARGRTIRLGPQPRDDRLVLLRRWLRVEPQLAARLDDETGGNTLLTIELLRDHVERGWLRPGPEGLQLVPGRGVVVPQDRLAPWMSRTQRATADDEDRAIQLELAAALGEEVTLAAWEAVGGEEAQQDRRALLDTLLSARLVESTATGFRFAHPLVRSAVLRGARAAGRFKEAHRTCLTWARVTGASPEVIAGHLVALEAWAEATVPLLDAAEARYDREGPAAAWESGRLAEQALERAGVARSDARWSRWSILRAQLLADRGRADEGLALLDEVDRGQLDGELRARARHVRAEILADLARVDEAWFLHLRNADDAKLPDELTVRTYDCLVTLALRQGRLDEAS
ncbi:MAG: AAA family ATPase, partial [Myxococcales bacterium]|nr:AAA family ATPase [Myxococcales bacterium]